MDVGVLHLAELPELRVGERRLRRAAAPQDDDLAHAAVGERVDRVVRGVGLLELGGACSASIRATSVATLPFPITTARSHERSNSRSAKSGWRVVPGDERGGRMRTGELLAGDPEVAVRGRSVRIDDGVEAVGELSGADVAADLDVAEEPESVSGRRLLVDADHRLDLRVVGRHAGARRGRTGSAGGRTRPPPRPRPPAGAGGRRRRSRPARSRRSPPAGVARRCPIGRSWRRAL